MYECTHICKFLVHLTYDIRQEIAQLEKDEKAENKECTVIRKKKEVSEDFTLICVRDCNKACKEGKNNCRKGDITIVQAEVYY